MCGLPTLVKDAREEVNFQPASSSGGENYGWGYCEGTRNNSQYYDFASFPAGCDCGTDSCFTLPVLEYDHGVGISITGGYVYRGVQYAASLEGTYFYADYASSILFGARPDGSGGITNVITLSGSPLSQVSTFGQDINGELYVGTLGGQIYRIKPVLSATPAPTAMSVPMLVKPSRAPSTAPSTAPTAPTLPIIDCPSIYENSMNLTTTGLVLEFSLRIPPDPNEADRYGGILCAKLVNQAESWVGFALSTDTNMPGSEAIIGKPNDGTVLKYDMNSLSEPTLASTQSLLDASLVQSNGITTMTFTKLLKEPNEIEIDPAGSNIFLYAMGFDNNFGYHGADNRGSVVIEFCQEDTDCSNGSFCSPRVCSPSFVCVDGPPPCPSDKICVQPQCAPCSACDNNQSGCEATGKCSFQAATLPACLQDGNCDGCSRADCDATSDCNWIENSCQGSISSPVQGSCTGNNPPGKGLCIQSTLIQVDANP